MARYMADMARYIEQMKHGGGCTTRYKHSWVRCLILCPGQHPHSQRDLLHIGDGLPTGRNGGSLLL